MFRHEHAYTTVFCISTDCLSSGNLVVKEPFKRQKYDTFKALNPSELLTASVSCHIRAAR